MEKTIEHRRNRSVGPCRALKVIIGVMLLGLVSSQCWAYSGGQGTLQLPYVLSSPEDLIQLGTSLDDYDKHFVLMADIDLAGHFFDEAVIAPTDAPFVSSFYSEGTFTGTIDGNGHVISNLTVIGGNHLGLVGALMYPGQILGVGIVDANVVGTGRRLGMLVGHNEGHIRQCFALGSIAGETEVGGLVGRALGTIENSFTGGSVSGVDRVGGLTGGSWSVDLINCYSTCFIQKESGRGEGGLTGIESDHNTFGSFWDVETSGISSGVGGTGLTTILLQEKQTYLQAGWDFVGESENGLSDIWLMPEAGGYPELSIFYGMQPSLPFDSGVALGRCTLSENPNKVIWNGAGVFDVTWDHVSRTEAMANPIAHPSLDPNDTTRTMTIHGNFDVLDSQNLLGIDVRAGVVCQVLDEQGEILSLEGKLSPFEPSFCWTLFPEKSQPFDLQFQLDSAQTIPSHLSQVDFYVHSLDCDLITTIDVTFESMETWKELVPGFEVMIENVVIQDERWEYTLRERSLGKVVDLTITSDLTLCETNGSPGNSRGLGFTPDLWGAEIIFNRNIILGEDHVATGGSTNGRTETIDGFRVTTTTQRSIGHFDIVKLEYIFAVSPHKRIVPLTLTNIPMP